MTKPWPHNGLAMAKPWAGPLLTASNPPPKRPSWKNCLNHDLCYFHKHKKDAPSGTAITLGEFAAKGRKSKFQKTKVFDRTKKIAPRKKGEIGFSVTRGGEVAGEHTVSFIGENDRIDLIHKASNRSIFVSGAIEAAIFLSKKKKGFFDMHDLLLK